MQHISTAQKQVIQIAIAALLLIGCVAVLLPFTGTLLFACVSCMTTAPFHRKILKYCHGRSSLAAVLMSCILLVLLVAPVALLSGSLVCVLSAMFARQLFEGQRTESSSFLLLGLAIAGMSAAATAWMRHTARRWAEEAGALDKSGDGEGGR